MTPAARLSAAMVVLDHILTGSPAEAALTSWARASRFAGSGDRYAIRDVVFDALRCKRSYAALGGGMTGRGLVLGGLRNKGLPAAEIDALFCGQGHAPHAIGPADTTRTPFGAEALDMPDWLMQDLHQSLGPDLPAATLALRGRAPTFLRVNPARNTRAAVAAELAQNGVETTVVQSLQYGLQVTSGERKISALKVFSEGGIELQDASSQAVVEALDIPKSGRILDYCAGAGGKILSIAAQAYALKNISFHAHDANPRRMADLPARAARAGAAIGIVQTSALAAPYDLILADVPCSGSGSWRRDPQGKWALTPERLAQLCQIQAQILQDILPLLAMGGVLAYSTCSLLRRENEDQIAAFLARNPQFHCRQMRRFGLTDGTGGDGFFLALLMQS